MFTEFVGLSQDVATSIERHRNNPAETKNDILRRLLFPIDAQEDSDGQLVRDLKQGVRVNVGERLFLYLKQPKAGSERPDGIAEVRKDGLYVDGQRVLPSRGSEIAPAMHIIQDRLNHINHNGQRISLSAYRQWYVKRAGRLVPLEDLKDPRQKRHRASGLVGVDLSKLDFKL